jgi:hypothetical protein
VAGMPPVQPLPQRMPRLPADAVQVQVQVVRLPAEAAVGPFVGPPASVSPLDQPLPALPSQLTSSSHMKAFYLLPYLRQQLRAWWAATVAAVRLPLKRVKQDSVLQHEGLTSATCESVPTNDP